MKSYNIEYKEHGITKKQFTTVVEHSEEEARELFERCNDNCTITKVEQIEDSAFEQFHKDMEDDFRLHHG